jgi:hypothetical protein
VTLRPSPAAADLLVSLSHDHDTLFAFETDQVLSGGVADAQRHDHRDA